MTAKDHAKRTIRSAVRRFLSNELFHKIKATRTAVRTFRTLTVFIRGIAHFAPITVISWQRDSRRVSTASVPRVDRLSVIGYLS